jgi:RecA-family ATPase
VDKTNSKVTRGISGDQIIAGSSDRAETLILGEYLAAGETMMLYAPTGQGKTVNALMLAVALTTGGKFYDWQAVKPCPVLFVEGGELTAYGIAERLRSIYKRQGITSDSNLHLKAPTKQNPFTYNITDVQHQKLLLRYIEDYDIRCVVFDNYNSLRREEDNEFMAWQRLEVFLNKLKTLKVSSVIIHHTNKEGRQQSGAQRKSDFCDLILRIEQSRLSTKKGKGDTKGKLYIEVEMEKFRWGEVAPITLTELIFRDKEIELIPANYEQVLRDSIHNDLMAYGKTYVKDKYKFLGYKLFHYTQSLMEEALPASSHSEVDDFF